MTENVVEALHAFVHGRVQGVGFRAFVMYRARDLGLVGYARNLSDGVSVEVRAEGPRADLEQLLVSLRAGPPSSYVERVDASWWPPTGTYAEFGTR
jgi:acylphosphatase